MQHQPTPPLELAALVFVTERGCWEWQGQRLKSGYGHYKRTTAHRWVYERLVGPIPAGLQIDHLCRNRPCVNPAHLEPVTPLENIRRGKGHGSETHCPHGHPYDEENTRWRARGSGRDCRACDRIAHRKSAARGM